jgi:alpha-L-fucosidase
VPQPTALILAFCLLAQCVQAQSPLAVPTPQQAAWHDLEVGMFIHIAPQTWQGKESDDLSTPLSAINPDKLDTDQWVRVAKSMSARYIVFVAKHEGGFCWWPTKTTTSATPPGVPERATSCAISPNHAARPI